MLNSVLMFALAFVANIFAVAAGIFDDDTKKAMEEACGNLPTKMQDEIQSKCSATIDDFIKDGLNARTNMLNCMKEQCQNKTVLIIAIAAASLCLVGCTVYCCMKRR